MPVVWRNTDPTAVAAPNGIFLTSFPSAGLAATIAGHYIVRTLNLPRVAIFEGLDAPPIAVVQEGEVNPPVRVYGRPGLSVVLSELPLDPGLANGVAAAILNEAERQNARLVIGLEGVMPHPTEPSPEGPAPGPGEESVWVACSTAHASVLGPFEAAKARRLEDGAIAGLSGALLVGAIPRKVPVAVLLVSALAAAEGFPDHRAGAALIETLDRVLPELKIDTAPLRTQAEVIEKALRSAMRAHPKTLAEPTTAPANPSIYG
ncbi:MAG: PAC2 family protein [Thermoplasmata archaeon]|jgi:predicted ATP-grasp superfamily ATP-dependent carboligase|nr:PAC2 family protein [Thermoplasmata archaeon]